MKQEVIVPTLGTGSFPGRNDEFPYFSPSGDG